MLIFVIIMHLFCNYSLHLRNIDYICSTNQLILLNMEENSRRKRFTKVATNRVQKIIDYLNLLQNCSNRRNYEYDEDDVNHMFEEISKALKDAKAVYANELSKGNGKSGFTFNK